MNWSNRKAIAGTALVQGRIALMNSLSNFYKTTMIVFTCLTLALSGAPTHANAQQRKGFADSQEHRPYDDKLMRLAEILGATHYLRELCSAQEGQRWRQQMDALIDAEGTSAKRRSRLVRKFNRGYRGYQRTYRSCTRPATLAIDRFLKEGITLSQAIIRTNK